MSAYEDAYARHQQARWMRPDAHRWIRQDAARFLPPGVDPARVYPALERKYSPDQPRVPAGSGRESGRWTDGGGGSGAGGGVTRRPYGAIDFGDLPSFSELSGLFQTAPSEIDNSGYTQLAGDASQRIYTVNMDEEEARGGHALRDHVGKTDIYLLETLRQKRIVGLFGSIVGQREGSFDSYESANNFVNRTLELNKADVDLVASGVRYDNFITHRFGSVTGREAYRENANAEPYLRNTYSVGVYIVRDTSSDRGFRVHTAYPRND
jgi:hypothetical protein